VITICPKTNTNKKGQKRKAKRKKEMKRAFIFNIELSTLAKAVQCLGRLLSFRIIKTNFFIHSFTSSPSSPL